jgi:tetratricopeptide (TPR) repeat protein
MKSLSSRRVAVMLGVSGLILAGMIAYRVVTDRTTAIPSDANASVPDTLFQKVSIEQMIGQLQDQLRANPENTAAYANLGWAFLQRVRETGDAALYAKAETAFHEALQRDPQQLDALTGMGSLALSRHQFVDAIRWGEQARAISPYRAQIYGILGDGQTELGQYEEAVASVQKMVDTRPDLNSYSRVSYQRELHGNVAGAIDAMQRAIQAGNPQSEGTLWTVVQLGNLYFNSGQPAQAEAVYQQALQVKPDYVYAQAGVARVRAAQGKYDEAIPLYRDVIGRLPMPEFIIALSDIYEVTNQTSLARQEENLVRAIQQIYTSAGVDVDMELALFEADHGGDPQKVVAQARASLSRRPTVYAADTLAWALYQAGSVAEARQYSEQALRLGTQDALLHYHAAMIAHALGDEAYAQTHLQKALAINPAFSIRYSSKARVLLTELAHSGS